MHTNRRAGVDSLTLVYILVLGALAALFRQAPYYLFDGDRPYAWNLMPVGALALFAGSRLRSAWAWLVPLGIMLVSDLLLWYPLAEKGMSTFSLGTPIIYGSFAVYVLIGRMIERGELSPMVIGGAALLGGVQFFVLTNFAVWLSQDLYPRTLGGLVECYTLAWPFYKNTLAGDLLYSGLIFGLHAALVWLAAPQPWQSAVTQHSEVEA
jgi:hypothetical protein